MGSGVTSLGRAKENAVRLQEYGVSSRHAEITVRGGRVRIRDLGSANGVFVNSRAVPESEIAPGDRILLGSVLIFLQEAVSDRIVIREQAGSFGRQVLPWMVLVALVVVALGSWWFRARREPARAESLGREVVVRNLWSGEVARMAFDDPVHAAEVVHRSEGPAVVTACGSSGALSEGRVEAREITEEQESRTPTLWTFSPAAMPFDGAPFDPVELEGGRSLLLSVWVSAIGGRFGLMGVGLDGARAGEWWC